MDEMFQQPNIRVPDATIALGVQVAAQALNQQVMQLMPLWQQAQKIVAAKTPQPPIDPAVQKTFEAAMAEIQRKSQVDANTAALDKMTLGMKQAEQQFNQQQVVQQMQQQAQQQQAEFQRELQMFMQGMQQERDQLQATIKKNNDDFLIKLMQIEQANDKLKQEAIQKEQEFQSKLNDAITANQPDFAPHLKQMGDMLAQMKESKNNETLDALMKGMHGVMTHLASPTEVTLIKSPDGQTIGARKSVAQIGEFHSP